MAFSISRGGGSGGCGTEAAYRRSLGPRRAGDLFLQHRALRKSCHWSRSTGGVKSEGGDSAGSQFRPEMARQHGGLYPDERAQSLITSIGERLVSTNPEVNQSPCYFQFHLLADPETVSALCSTGRPGVHDRRVAETAEAKMRSPVFLGHEGGSCGRPSFERADGQGPASQGLVNAVVMAGGSDYGMTAGQIAQFVSQLKNTAYSRDDGLESDKLGVRFMKRAGYDPNALVRVMEVLKEAAGGVRLGISQHAPRSRQSRRAH